MSERVVALGATEYFIFNTSQFSTGAPFTLAGTPVVSIYEDNGTTEITAGITLTVDLDSRTGMHGVAVVASGANGFEAGKRYIGVITTGTVDSVSVVGKKVFEFRIETVSEKAARELNDYLYPENEISTVTSNSTTAINLTDVVDAQTDDDSLIGQLLLVRDATDGALVWAVITDLASLVATVELYPNGGAMPITVAAGDRVWLMGPVYGHKLGTGAQADIRTATGLASADLDTQLDALPTAAEIQAELEANGASVIDTIRDVLGALDDAAAAGDPTTTDTVMAYLKQLINILVGTTGIATFPSAAVAANGVSLAEVIRSIDTRLPSALNNGTIPADMQRINDVAVTGDGSATPFDVV